MTRTFEGPLPAVAGRYRNLVRADLHAGHQQGISSRRGRGNSAHTCTVCRGWLGSVTFSNDTGLIGVEGSNGRWSSLFRDCHDHVGADCGNNPVEVAVTIPSPTQRESARRLRAPSPSASRIARGSDENEPAPRSELELQRGRGPPAVAGVQSSNHRRPTSAKAPNTAKGLILSSWFLSTIGEMRSWRKAPARWREPFRASPCLSAICGPRANLRTVTYKYR